MNTIAFNYLCRTCGALMTTGDGNSACAKFKMVVNPQHDGCTWHISSEFLMCDKCGGAILDNPILYESQDKYYCLCENCYNGARTCACCANHTACGFEMDDSTQKYVIQQTTQVINGMRVSTQNQVKNPELVTKHCVNCVCGNCNRDNNGVTCPSWIFHI